MGNEEVLDVTVAVSGRDTVRVLFDVEGHACEETVRCVDGLVTRAFKCDGNVMREQVRRLDFVLEVIILLCNYGCEQHVGWTLVALSE